MYNLACVCADLLWNWQLIWGESSELFTSQYPFIFVIFPITPLNPDLWVISYDFQISSCKLSNYHPPITNNMFLINTKFFHSDPNDHALRLYFAVCLRHPVLPVLAQNLHHYFSSGQKHSQTNNELEHLPKANAVFGHHLLSDQQ